MFDEYQLGLYEGKMNERERIIALLQREREESAIYGVQIVCDVLGNLIALIKGENK